MSHFTEVKTKIKNEDRIKKVLKRLNFNVVENDDGLNVGVNVRGFFGETTLADFKITTKSNYDIGFLKNSDGTYEILGDWELLPKVSGIEKDLFTNKISQEYAFETIKDLAEENGYSLDYEKSENGELELVVTQW